MSYLHRYTIVLVLIFSGSGCGKPSQSAPETSHKSQSKKTVIALQPTAPAANSKSTTPTPKVQTMNALAKSQSPYLLQHAHNPVNWVEWGDEAFERAHEQGKPILLSIGYSTCHWCHVMAHESFEDEAVAKFINEHFIAIKVDREERPDIDRIYMTYVQATTGHGGWPMTVFLTPERIPFYGGTYYPKARFMDLLATVTELWATKRNEFTGIGQQFVDYLHNQVAETKPNAVSDLQSEQLLKTVVSAINSQYDETYAGFGSAPKFPRPVIFAPLINFSRFHQKDPLSLQVMDRTLATLRAMANGGMYDHIGGGFHRYSVDQYWHVPHFEKMMYDQGQLAVVYADVGRLLGEKQLISVAEDICNYVQHRMTSPEGGFYSAEDADSLVDAQGHESKEGAYYVWEFKELVNVLGAEDAKLCAAYYQSTETGNVRPESDPQREFVGQNVFTRVSNQAAFATEHNLSLEQLDSNVSAWRKALYAVRSNRPSPHLDDKIMVAWNGLMISGFVHTYLATGKKSYLKSAEDAVAAVRRLCWDEKQKILYRLFRGERGSVRGFADDYSMLIQALLDLHEATGSASALQWARELHQVFHQHFSRKAGGWYETDGLDRSLLSRMQESYEGAEPGANAVAVRNGMRLASLLGEEVFAIQARTAITRYSKEMQQQSQALPLMITNAYLADRNTPSVVIVEGTGADALRAVFHEIAVPGSTLLNLNEETRKILQAPWLQAMKNRDGVAQAFVCEGKSCKAPTIDPDEFRQQLKAALSQLNLPD